MQTIFACITCNKNLQSAIAESARNPGLAQILAPFVAVAIISAVLVIIGRKRNAHPAIPLIMAGIILGMGFGGLIDGILLHQILQWHGMLSHRIAPDTLAGKSVNMFWDGVFHAAMLCVLLTGGAQLWSVMRREEMIKSGTVLIGAMLIGWGAFNIVEGIIDHQILKLHVVREVSAAPEAWNLGFLGISALLIGLGVWMTRRRRAIAMH